MYGQKLLFSYIRKNATGKLMKNLLLTLLFAIGTFAVRAEERNLLQHTADRDRVRAALVTGRKWVPYPAYTDRAGWNALTGENREMLTHRGEKGLDFEWKVIRATDYLEFERSGNRKIMEDRNNANLKTLTDLIVAELAEGEGRFIDQIINGAFHLCEMTSWALSAHTKLQHSRRALPEKDDHVIALVSCEAGAILAWTDYFFAGTFDRIDPSISRRIRREVRERIFDTYLSQGDRFWWTGFREDGNHTINNWNPWCNCNILQCFLLLEENPDRLADAVYRTMQSVDKFLDYVKGDGACEEGPAYWEAAGGKAYDYLQVLGWATGGRISLFDQPLIRDMGEYISRSYVGDGWVVNFADASARGANPAPLIYRYGKAVGSDEMMRFAAALVTEKRSAPLSFGRDLLRTLESIRFCGELTATTPEQPSHTFTWYPETQFCYMRLGGLFLAAKGGHNNESHNHNDIGTFILYADSEPLLLDAGVGTYTRQTFSSKRYDIWSMQSDYHNLPKINGASQRQGAEYRATEVEADPRRRTFSLDIAGAYPAEAEVCRWRRGYRLQSNGITVTDNFELEAPTTPNELHFMCRGKADIATPGRVHITTPIGRQAVLRYDAASFEPSVELVPLSDPRLSNVWGDALLRLKLRARKVQAKDSYKITIELVK